MRQDARRGESPRTSLFDLDLERALLGALLLDPQRTDEIVELVKGEDFYDPIHQHLFEAIQGTEDRSSITPSVVKAALSAKGQLDAATADRLRTIEESSYTSAGVRELAAAVADKGARRRVVEFAGKLGELAGAAELSTAQLFDRAEQLAFQTTERSRRSEPRLLEHVLGETLPIIQKMAQSHSSVTGLPTGILDLDDKTTGFHPGELFILAARPGVGKTSLAMNMALHGALRADPPRTVAVFSLEMPSTQLAFRIICSEARISQGKLRTGRLSDYDLAQITEHVGALWHAPIFVDDTGSLSILDLRSKARRITQQVTQLGLPPLGFIVVDYLQLMRGTGSEEARHLEIAEISRGLKSLSKELSVPVLALSQLSRDVEKGKRKPQLSDLRESGSIEQDADCVMFIHKDLETEPKGGLGGPIEVQLIIAKQRNGPTGEIDLLFMSEYTRFENVAKDVGGPPPG